MGRLGVISALVMLVAWTAVASSNAEPLRIGDPAPPLALEQWVQGDSTAADLESGRVTVLEFWATWCPSSRIILSRRAPTPA